MAVVTLTCTGNFLIGGGSISADERVTLFADGSLVLENVSITAPIIQLSSGTTLSLASTVTLRATSAIAVLEPGPGLPEFTVPSASLIVLGSGDNARTFGPGDRLVGSIRLPGDLRPLTGGTIIFSPAVPEPSAVVLIIAGVLLVLAKRLRDQFHCAA
jgi:hypothetical protein